MRVPRGHVDHGDRANAERLGRHPNRVKEPLLLLRPERHDTRPFREGRARRRLERRPKIESMPASLKPEPMPEDEEAPNQPEPRRKLGQECDLASRFTGDRRGAGSNPRRNELALGRVASSDPGEAAGRTLANNGPRLAMAPNDAGSSRSQVQGPLTGILGHAARSTLRPVQYVLGFPGQMGGDLRHRSAELDRRHERTAHRLTPPPTPSADRWSDERE